MGGNLQQSTKTESSSQRGSAATATLKTTETPPKSFTGTAAGSSFRELVQLESRPESPSAKLFKDKNSPTGLNGQLSIRQQDLGNCHLVGAVYGLSTTTAGDQVLASMVKQNPKNKNEYQVTFRSGETATVSTSDLKVHGLSESPAGVRAIEVGEAKVRQKTHQSPSADWKDHANGGNFTGNTLSRLTGNSTSSVSLQRVPKEARTQYVSDIADGLKVNRENIVAMTSMVSEKELQVSGIKTSAIRVDESGKHKRYLVTLSDGESATFTEQDLKRHKIDSSPAAPDLFKLAKTELAAGRLSQYQPSCSGWKQGEETRYLPSGLPYVSGHAHVIVDVNKSRQTISVVNPWDTTRMKEVPYKEFGAAFREVTWSPIAPGTTGNTMVPNEYRWLDQKGLKPVFSKRED